MFRELLNNDCVGIDDMIESEINASGYDEEDYDTDIVENLSTHRTDSNIYSMVLFRYMRILLM